jgi:hypothetical protein
MLDRCGVGARHKPACGDYIDDPLRMAEREALWTFRVRAAGICAARAEWAAKKAEGGGE